MLGLQLGRLPSELANMTAAEETLLMSYYRSDPWGDHRADIRSAQIVKMIYDVHRGKKGKDRKLTDFLMFYKRPKPDEETTGKKLELLKTMFTGKK